MELLDLFTGPYFTYILFQYIFPMMFILVFILWIISLYVGRYGKPFSLFAKGLLIWMVWETGEAEPLLCKVFKNVVRYGKNKFAFLPQTVNDDGSYNLNKRFTVKGLNRPFFYCYAPKATLYTPEYIKLALTTKKMKKKLDDEQKEALRKRQELIDAKALKESDINKPIEITIATTQDLRSIREMVDQAWPSELMEELEYLGAKLEREGRGGGGGAGKWILIAMVAAIGAMAFLYLYFGGAI